jgi:N-formylglutamate amidohydrolase
VFTLSAARRDERPLVVEVPHAGLAVPDDVRGQLRVSAADVMRDADLFVDRFYAGTLSHGGSLLVSHVSRYVVDLNRAEDDIDRDIVPDHPRPRPLQSRGVVWRTTTSGQPVMDGTLSHAQLEQRLARYHRPYHAALEAEIERKRRRCSSSARTRCRRSRGRARRAAPMSFPGAAEGRRRAHACSTCSTRAFAARGSA